MPTDPTYEYRVRYDDGDLEGADDLDEAEELAADLDVELAADLDGVAQRRTVTYGPWEDAPDA